MTGLAFRGLMFSRKLKLSLVMVEMRGIQLNEFSGAPLVFPVTGLAVGHLGLSMVARLLFYVLFDFLVTGHAFFIKNLLDEIVTIQALPLVFFMDVCHFPGHDPLQEIQGIRNPPCRKNRYDDDKRGSFPHRVFVPSFPGPRTPTRLQYARSV